MNPEMKRLSTRVGRLLTPTLALLALVSVTLVGMQQSKANALARSVSRLTTEVNRLRQEQSMPVDVLAQHRNSICFLHAVYSLTRPDLLGRGERVFRARVSATGFVAAPGVIATNRHVVQPWWDDDHDQELIRQGASPKLEKLEAFFPDSSTSVPLYGPEVSSTADVAVVRFKLADAGPRIKPLPLASEAATPGDPVVVVGYPLGVTTMLAKSPGGVYKRLAYTHDTVDIARDLAAHYLIRPSATYGHLGDVVDDKLVYDAPTAQGGSGGPVFDSEGNVIGVNAAYIDGFAGGTIGISVQALKPLVESATESDLADSRAQH